MHNILRNTLQCAAKSIGVPSTLMVLRKSYKHNSVTTLQNTNILINYKTTPLYYFRLNDVFFAV